MRQLWFGGSFNPIHHGHLICARAVAEVAGYNQVTLIPSAFPPHKRANAEMAAFEHRLSMCRLAASSDALFSVDDLENHLPPPNYTRDTARALHQKGHTEVAWLIGADMAASLPQWHDPTALLAEVKFVLMARPGWKLDLATLPPEFHILNEQIVESPRIDISSTQIRKRLRAGLSIDFLTPPPVADYIRQQNLYQRGENPMETQSRC